MVCFTALRQIHSVQRSVTHDALLTLLRSLVIMKLDFGGSALTGVSGSLMQWLQSVLNAAARLVFSARRSEHTTPLLRELHWLKVPERIQYRDGCVSWPIVVCMVLHHHTLLRHFT